MVEPLQPLLADGVIEEVLARLKSGKEADIYLVQHAGEVVAAKVYKERHARNFRNNAAYKEGRQVRDTRTQRALQRGSRFGIASAEEAWKAKESEALHTLHAAGVRVPRPIMFYEGVLLMEAVVDAEGRPARRLVDAAVHRDQAAACYADLRQQAVKMLACDLIHGDLSAYNVLLAWDGPTVIDFPQVVGAAHNSQARSFFQRDLQNIRRFLAAIDPALHAASEDASEIWRAYERRELTPDFVPSGRRREEGRPRERQPAHAPRHGQQHAPRADHGRQQAQQHAPRADHGRQQAQQHAPRADHRRQQAQQHAPRADHGKQQAQQHAPRADHGKQQAQQHAPRADHAKQQAQQHAPRADHGQHPGRRRRRRRR
jgi:RIO kinase 1